jgi:hypothetical protein
VVRRLLELSGHGDIRRRKQWFMEMLKVDPLKRASATALMQRLELPAHLPAAIVEPGSIIGTLLPEVAGHSSLAGTPIVAPASHDNGFGGGCNIGARRPKREVNERWQREMSDFFVQPKGLSPTRSMQPLEEVFHL